MNTELSEIFKPPLSMIISAKRFSGKTFLIKEILNSKYIKKTYKEVYVFTDTGFLDKTWEQVNNKNVYIDDEFEEEKLFNLLESLKEDYLETKKKTNVLIIIDDLVEVYRQSKKSIITLLATRSRQYGVGYIFTTQTYNILPPTVRKNSTTKLLFKITNRKEMNCITEELSSRNMPGEVLEELIDETTKPAYQYILIKENENGYEYYKGNGLNIKEIK